MEHFKILDLFYVCFSCHKSFHYLYLTAKCYIKPRFKHMKNLENQYFVRDAYYVLFLDAFCYNFPLTICWIAFVFFMV